MGLTVTEDPVIRSNIRGGPYPSVDLNAYLDLQTGNCLGMGGRMPIFERGMVWDPAAQTLIYPSGAFAVGDMVRTRGSVLPIAEDLQSVIGRRAYEAVGGCRARHDADEIVLIYNPPSQ